MRFSARANCLWILICWAQLAWADILYQEPWGKDSGIRVAAAKEVSNPVTLPVTLAQGMIRFHQTIISPVDGPRSHFRPSSSEYMRLAMERYGFFKGFAMGCDRLLRENGDKWVYRTIEDDGKTFKYDPAKEDKH